MVGVDVSHPMLKLAREKVKNLDENLNIRFQQMDANHLDFPEECSSSEIGVDFPKRGTGFLTNGTNIENRRRSNWYAFLAVCHAESFGIDYLTVIHIHNCYRAASRSTGIDILPDFDASCLYSFFVRFSTGRFNATGNQTLRK